MDRARPPAAADPHDQRRAERATEEAAALRRANDAKTQGAAVPVQIYVWFGFCSFGGADDCSGGHELHRITSKTTEIRA